MILAASWKRATLCTTHMSTPGQVCNTLKRTIRLVDFGPRFRYPCKLIIPSGRPPQALRVPAILMETGDADPFLGDLLLDLG